MKRILSWIALWFGIAVTYLVINFVVYYSLRFASGIYENNRTLFWIIIFVGGSFGLGIAYYITAFSSATCVSLSNKIKPSEKGTRYLVAAIIMTVYSLLEIIYCFVMRFKGTGLAKQIIVDVLTIFLAFFLYCCGKSKLNED
jgi:hypothetical protein